jgi:segregation and condensation protein A
MFGNDNMEINLKIDDFEGPLDLLLHLIKEKKMDLLNLKLEIIIDEYLDFIDKMERMNLDIASSYLVMASELLEMKSKLLLPRTETVEEEEEEDPKEVLVNKLIEYQKYKELTSDFRELENERHMLYTKLPESLKEYGDGDTLINNSDVTLDDLLEAFQKFLERKKSEQPLNTKVTSKEMSVEERTISIRNILSKKKRVNFIELFDVLNKEYVVVTFLAILEMARRNEIKISQEKKYGDIICEVDNE